MRTRFVWGIVALLVLAGCKLNTDYFKDYRGKNLLANYGFDATTATANKWNLEPFADYSTGGDHQVTGYAATDYMTWEKVGSGANDATLGGLTQGPDAGQAYRLEIKNLLPDGDFEAESDGASTFSGTSVAFWSNDSSPAVVDFESGSTVTLNSFPFSSLPQSHRSLFFSFPTGPVGYLQISLNGALGQLWTRFGNYRFRLDFYNATQGDKMVFKMIPQNGDANSQSTWADWTVDGINATDPNTVYSLSQVFDADGSTLAATAVIGDKLGNAQDAAVVDNIRVVQNDLPPYVIASLPSLHSGSLALLPGTKSGAYSFSVYVHDDPTADQAGAVHVLNRFNASGITIKVSAAIKPTSGNSSYNLFFARPAGGWTTWTKLTIPFGFDFVDSDSQIPTDSSALTIEISPTDSIGGSGGRDAGSVLIAEPVLTFNP